MENLIVVGSVACQKHGIPLGRKPLDIDVIGDEKSAIWFAEKWAKITNVEDTEKGITIFTSKTPVEVELITKDKHTETLFNAIKETAYLNLFASPDWLYFMKMSHRYKKNSPHFMKTMRDIHILRKNGAKMPEGSEELFKERERLTYTYGHPKLNVSKKEFFDGDGVNYIYDHDSIHEAIAIDKIPAYKNYMIDGEQVLTSKEKFFSADKRVRMLGVYEESCVLALERSQVPFDFKPDPEQSFYMALEKVCTSITSGWFREYAWEHWLDVKKFYEYMGKTDYIRRFNEFNYVLKPFKGSVY